MFVHAVLDSGLVPQAFVATWVKTGCYTLFTHVQDFS